MDWNLITQKISLNKFWNAGGGGEHRRLKLHKYQSNLVFTPVVGGYRLFSTQSMEIGDFVYLFLPADASGHFIRT